MTCTKRPQIFFKVQKKQPVRNITVCRFCYLTSSQHMHFNSARLASPSYAAADDYKSRSHLHCSPFPPRSLFHHVPPYGSSVSSHILPSHHLHLLPPLPPRALTSSASPSLPSQSCQNHQQPPSLHLRRPRQCTFRPTPSRRRRQSRLSLSPLLATQRLGICK